MGINIPPYLLQVLAVHQQWFTASCAASAMEIILKYHRKLDLDDYPFQREFGSTNIGFEKLDRLAKYGIITQTHQFSWLELKTEMEAKGDNLCLVSFPSALAFDLIQNKLTQSILGFHIWIGLSHSNNLVLCSKSHLSSYPIHIHNMDKSWI